MVRLHELCQRYLNSLGIVFPTDHVCGLLDLAKQGHRRLSVYCHSGISNRLNRLGPPLRRDRVFNCLSMNCNCWASKHCVTVISQRLVCHSCCSTAAPVESPKCSVDTCVGDETVDASGASAVRSLILFSAWCTSLHVWHFVISYACVVISGSLRRRCLQLALLFCQL